MRNRDDPKSKSLITNQIMDQLLTAYPRALSYSDLFETVLNGVPASARHHKQGGTYLNKLVNDGRIKRICRGFYCAIPK